MLPVPPSPCGGAALKRNSRGSLTQRTGGGSHPTNYDDDGQDGSLRRPSTMHMPFISLRARNRFMQQQYKTETCIYLEVDCCPIYNGVSPG
jgi:hypothetical protein